MKKQKLVPSALICLLCGVLFLTGCQDDAQVATHNLTKAADNFEINRRVVFMNGITDSYMLSVEGLCSVENNGARLSVICKVGKNEFKRHFLGLSDNVTYFVEQLEPSKASVYRYRVTFKPEVIIPDIDLRTSAGN